MKLSAARRKSGFAVIIALVAVTVLSIMAGLFAYAMKIETRLAANANNDEQFYWIGRGGIDRACWWLALEGNQPYSSLQQYWAGGPGDGPETNSPLAFESLDSFPIGPGTVSLHFTELESKINVNVADTPLLRQVLTTMGANAGDISTVADSILNWIDGGTRPAGATSEYYLGSDPPHFAKNAPLDSIDELRLIKGVTPKMFDGTGQQTGPDMASAQHQLGVGHLLSQEPDYPFFLTNVFTPFSSGKVNLLTADENVLSALPSMDNATLQIILTQRDAANIPPNRSLAQLLAGVPPQAVQQFSRYLDVRGDTYEVRATAKIGDVSHEYTAILVRNRGGNAVQVFNFYRSK